MKVFKTSLLAIAMLAIVSCSDKKKEEPFGKIETTEEVTTTNEATENISDGDLAIVNKGKEIFEGKGTCVACHQPSTKVVGPSLKEISGIYKEKNSSIVTFLKGEGEAIVDPSQYEVMKANFAITKAMSDEELQSLEAYIHSF
ncbi:c-type cytochrome [Flavobacterium sp. N2270]|uniref:c-type cytochrome n=1 Tax=Flavobacterium sp. N2270 TaxID=2986831 RepID=UPI002223F7E7|nr:c-type cytochrome [Flavobacterium sp. N2270]